jgi:hypothetical protein
MRYINWKRKIKGFEMHHSYRRFNAAADKLSTIASGRNPVLDGVFASDLYEPSTKSSNQMDKRVRRMMTKSPLRPRLEGWWSWLIHKTGASPSSTNYQ